MNAKQIQQVDAISRKIVALYEELDGIREDAQDAFDNMPESLQQAEQGERADSHIQAADQAVSDLQGIVDTLAEIQ